MIKYKIAALINESKKSSREIARATGLSHPTLLRLMRADDTRDYNVSADTIDRLGTYFNCKSIEELVEYSPSPMPKGQGGPKTK